LLSFVPDNNAALYRDELKQNAARLIETLSDFKINAKVLDAKRGPTVTRYELQPGTGVKTSKIANLSDDIALHLAAPAVRIEAPIPGKSAIGIEIPNRTTSVVYLKEIVGSEEFAVNKSKISVALGKSISGQPMVIDLAKMPHLLIAGATGSGKSVCINSILISLLYKATPDEVKLILVDPKVVELNVYNGIPHLLIPVVTDPSKAAGALSWAVGEMLQRYKMFADKNVRNFNGYNDSLVEGEKKLPQVVIVIDELADLMMTAKGDVEDSICRLAQMGRAAGIHLVIATQRPSADVITGLIKANVPSRIAFAVSSAINSHIILDASGAEKLVGKGDMLYSPLGEVKPIRVQGCFVSDQEVEKAVKAVKNGKENTYDDNIIKQIEQNAAMQKAGSKAGSDDDEEVDDPKLDEAIQCVVEKGQASTTMLQKFVGLGYVRASKLIDVMEARGIVGPYQGSTPREVLITKAQWQEMKARKQ
ncbi:MAG: DNA translocase FtsK, partial [Clostridia bacterium]|nr:DNA translocase FtsK [Clostridia bacterium]